MALTIKSFILNNLRRQICHHNLGMRQGAKGTSITGHEAICQHPPGVYVRYAMFVWCQCHVAAAKRQPQQLAIDSLPPSKEQMHVHVVSVDIGKVQLADSRRDESLIKCQEGTILDLLEGTYAFLEFG